MVGDIRDDIGRDTVGANKDKVLVRAEVGGFEPESPLGLIGTALFLEEGNNLVHLAALMQGGLPEPVIVDDPVFFQVPFQPGNIQGQCEIHQRFPAFLRRSGNEPVAILLGKSFGMGGDILAQISVLRHFNAFLIKLEIPSFQ